MLSITTLIASSLLYVALAKFQLKRRKNQKLSISASAASAITKNNPKALEEYRLDRDLSIATTALVASAGGFFYPPLNLVSIPGIVWVCAMESRDAYLAYRQGRGLGADALAAVFEIGAILTGNYFAAAMGASFGRLSKKLLNKTEDKSKQNLISIFSTQTTTAWVVEKGVELAVPVKQLKIGEVVIVHAGETIPVDGRIIAGSGVFDEHILTGESRQLEKDRGDYVFASTILLSGKINIEVDKAGNATVAEQIGHILNHTADFKQDILSQGEKLADRSARITMVLSLVTLPFFGATTSLTVLNSSLGFYMRVLGPISMLSFLNVAAQKGLLIKDGRSLQLLKHIDTVVFDKTGTLTLEQPHVGAIYTCHDVSEEKLLSYAAAAEHKQNHPIALAIKDEAHTKGLALPSVHHAEYLVGYGLKVTIAAQQVCLGSKKLMHIEGITMPDSILNTYQQGHEDGYSFVFIAVNGQLWGMIELQATIRPEAKKVVQVLQAKGVATYIISGDQHSPTQKLAAELGIKHYFAETLPEDKSKLIAQLQEQGKSVCFVGDGINDAIALKKANVSISLRGASTVATDTAQIVLMNSNLNQLIQAFNVAHDFDNNMKLNYLATTLPGAITLYGAYFLNFGVLPSVILNDLGIVVGASNAVLPWLKEKHKEQRHQLTRQAK